MSKTKYTTTTDDAIVRARAALLTIAGDFGTTSREKRTIMRELRDVIRAQLGDLPRVEPPGAVPFGDAPKKPKKKREFEDPPRI